MMEKLTFSQDDYCDDVDACADVDRTLKITVYVFFENYRAKNQIC